MTMVHTAHGLGEIIASETSRGRTHYKVAVGPGTQVWLDETEVNLRTASEPSGEGENLFTYAPEMEAYRHLSFGVPEHSPKGHGYYGEVTGSNPRDRAQNHTYSESRDRGWDEHGRQDVDWHPSDAYEFENRGPEDIYSDDAYDMGPGVHSPHHLAPDVHPGADLGEFGDELGGALSHEFENSGYNHHAPGYDPHRDYTAWEDGTTASIHEGFGSSAFAHEPPGPIIDYEDPPVYPYDPTPQFPVDMFRHEQTISPDHELDLDKRTSPTHALTLEDADELTYPGPDPKLFAKGAARGAGGLEPWPSERHEQWMEENPDAYPEESPHYNGPEYSSYSAEPATHRPRAEDMGFTRGDINRLKGRQGRDFTAAYVDAADHFNDPVQRFRDDPHGEIVRLGGIDVSAGLDYETGEEMRVVEADRQIFLGAWRDVSAKAKRLRREGAVEVEDIGHDRIYARVQGDTGIYDTMIAKGGDYGQVGQGISNWRCSCDWGKWAFKRQMTYVGRLCSHAYAAYLEMQSKHIKSNPEHPFNKRRRKLAADDESAGPEHGDGVSAFKSWADAENQGHIDMDAADRFITTSEDPTDKAEAQKIYDYALSHVSERPERDYDQDGYTLDNEEHYKTGEVLRTQPDKLTPDLVMVPTHEGEDAHYFTDLGDDRKTTGPEQIMAAKGDPGQHHPSFAWHDDDQEDFPQNGIVHFSAVDEVYGPDGQPYPHGRCDTCGKPSICPEHEMSPHERRAALIFTADDNLLNKLRDLSAKPQSDDFGDMKGRNEEISDVVKELRDRGYDVDQLVASIRRAMRHHGVGAGNAPNTAGEDDNRARVQQDVQRAEEGNQPPPMPNTGGKGNYTGPTPVAPVPAAANDPQAGANLGPSVGAPNLPPGALPGQGNGPHGAPPGGGGGAPPAPAGPAGPGGAPPNAVDVGRVTPAAGGPGPGPAAGGGGGGAPIGPGTYTVGEGDTLSGIAERAGDKGGYQDLVKGNPGNIGGAGTNLENNPNLIHPGDQIKIPGGATPAAGPTDNGPHGAPKSPMNPTEAQPGPSVTGQPAPPVDTSPANTSPGLTNPPAPTATPPLPSTLPGAPATPHTGAQHFAERYFFADDANPNSSDDENKPRAQMPAAGPPVGAGTDYKPTAPSTPNVAPTDPANPTTNPVGAPAGPSGNWVRTPHGPIDASGGKGGQNAENQIEHSAPGEGGAPPKGEGDKKQDQGGPLQQNPLQGIGDVGNIVGEVGSMIPGIGGMASGLGGLSSGIGNTMSGLGGLTHLFGSTDPAHYAMQYFQADGNFMGDGGGDWADYPFAGSGPARKDWATTSEDYVNEHSKGNRDETWTTDLDGDVTNYGTPPKQKKARRGRAVTPHSQQVHRRRADNVGSGNAGYGTGGGSRATGDGFVTTPEGSGMGTADPAPGVPGQTRASREFWADAYDPGQQGYFNPTNRPYQEDDSQQYAPHKKKNPRGGPGGPNPAEAAAQGGSASEAAGLGSAVEEAAPILVAASYDDDSDIVRQFQASAAAGDILHGNNSGGGGRFDDFAGAAASFLKTAGRNFTPAEQRELENEEHHLGARNLDGLDLRGTHYE